MTLLTFKQKRVFLYKFFKPISPTWKISALYHSANKELFKYGWLLLISQFQDKSKSIYLESLVY